MLAASALPCFIHEALRPGASTDAVEARRGLLMGLLLSSFPAAAAAEPRNSLPKYIKAGDPLPDLDPNYPPAPSEIPWIRELQKKSWEREPILRTRFYLMDEMTKIQPNPFGEKKDMVRWTEDPVKWDVLTAEDLKTAERYGKVLVDQDLTNEDMGWKSYIYTATQDRDWVAKNCNITQTIELTKAFQEQLELVRSHKFGE